MALGWDGQLVVTEGCGGGRSEMGVVLAAREVESREENGWLELKAEVCVAVQNPVVTKKFSDAAADGCCDD